MNNQKQQIYQALRSLDIPESKIQEVLPAVDTVDEALELISALDNKQNIQIQQSEQQNKPMQQQGLFNLDNLNFEFDFSDIKAPVDFDENKKFKMVCVVRNDLKMGVGKIAAQTGHAVIGAFRQLMDHPQGHELLEKWEECGTTKVVVKCESEEEILELERKSKQAGLVYYLVMDAGRTQIEPGSLTVLAIGPADSEILDSITGNLKLL